jgi:myo-inositol-1-phosphate synthase
LDRAQGGVLEAPSAYFCKHPPRQFTDDQAFHMIENFIAKDKLSVQEISDSQSL